MNWRSMDRSAQLDLLVLYVTGRLEEEQEHELIRTSLSDPALFAKLADLTPLRQHLLEVGDADRWARETEARPWWELRPSWLGWASGTALLLVAAVAGWLIVRQPATTEIAWTQQGEPANKVELSNTAVISLKNLRHPYDSSSSTSSGQLPQCIVKWEGGQLPTTLQQGRLSVTLPAPVLRDKRDSLFLDCGQGEIRLFEKYTLDRYFR